MSALPTALMQELREILLNSGRADLVRRLEEATAPELLTSTQAAELLGVSSPTTVKNWLMGGHFPGAFQTAGGHWRFPRADVERMRLRMVEDAERSAGRDLSLPDEEDDGDIPLL